MCICNFGGTKAQPWVDTHKKHKMSELPGNQSAMFAPINGPTLNTGVDACAVAALTLLDRLSRIWQSSGLALERSYSQQKLSSKLLLECQVFKKPNMTDISSKERR